jgi:antitoxin MazE
MPSPSDAYPLPAGLDADEDPFVYAASNTLFAAQPTRVFRAGNSLAIRIPSNIARQIGVGDGSGVEMAVNQGMIFVRKASSQELTNLIERITPENLQQPIFEDLTGGELW